jgi:hypothetical protein
LPVAGGLEAKLHALDVQNEGHIVALECVEIQFLQDIDRAVGVIELGCFEFSREAITVLVQNGIAQFPKILAVHVQKQSPTEDILVTAKKVLLQTGGRRGRRGEREKEDGDCK